MRRAACALAALFACAGSAAFAIDRSVYVPAVDYPAGVPVSSREYHVRIRYELDQTGHVVRCSVVERSGQPALDAETCRILQSRARIRPEPGRMHGTLVFNWLGEASNRIPHARGEPLAYNFAQVISDADYPREAVSRGESGAVGYEVTVSPYGAPRQCRVTESSGSQALDQRTCELVMQRSAYIAATDGSGPLGGVAHGRIRWEMPGG